MDLTPRDDAAAILARLMTRNSRRQRHFWDHPLAGLIEPAVVPGVQSKGEMKLWGKVMTILPVRSESIIALIDGQGIASWNYLALRMKCTNCQKEANILSHYKCDKDQARLCDDSDPTLSTSPLEPVNKRFCGSNESIFKYISVKIYT